MKRITTIAVCLLASLAAVGSASAQDHAAKATIPFNFSVSNVWLPSGTYTLTSDAASPYVVSLRNEDNKTLLINVAHADDVQPGSHTLVFKKIGNEYFLHAIHCATRGMNVAFPESKREKKAESREASLPAPTDVYLALK